MKFKTRSSDTERRGIPPRSSWFFYMPGVQLRYTEPTFYVPIRRMSPRTQWNYYGQQTTWNLRQWTRIQWDMEFHHSHPSSFYVPGVQFGYTGPIFYVPIRRTNLGKMCRWPRRVMPCCVVLGRFQQCYVISRRWRLVTWYARFKFCQHGCTVP